MEEIILIEKAETAFEILKPLRIEILKLLKEPHSCPELARKLGETTQKVYYHVKTLQESGLVQMVEERRVRGIMEGVYLAKARSYWFSPKLVSAFGGRKKLSEEISLGNLYEISELMQGELGQLASSGREDIPSFGINARVQLRNPEERGAFMKEMQDAIKKVCAKYGAIGEDAESSFADDSYRLTAACYPVVTETD